MSHLGALTQLNRARSVLTSTNYFAIAEQRLPMPGLFHLVVGLKVMLSKTSAVEDAQGSVGHTGFHILQVGPQVRSPSAHPHVHNPQLRADHGGPRFDQARRSPVTLSPTCPSHGLAVSNHLVANRLHALRHRAGGRYGCLEFVVRWSFHKVWCTPTTDRTTVKNSTLDSFHCIQLPLCGSSSQFALLVPSIHVHQPTTTTNTTADADLLYIMQRADRLQDHSPAKT